MEILDDIHLNKHVAAIHCTNNISLLQRKIYNALLFKAYNKLLDGGFHYISLSELSSLIDYNSKDSEKLKQAFRKLQSTAVEWNIIENKQDPNSEIWCSSTLLASSVIDKKRGYCRYEYSKTLAGLLYHPEVYARIDLRVQNKFSSSYGLALYENCIRYKNVNTSGWIAIDTFKKLMGVDKNKYTKFSDFNRRVLSAAIKEINDISDITVEVETQRVAQQVTAVKFNIAAKRKSTPLGVLSPAQILTLPSDVSDTLKNTFFASEQDIATLSKNYAHDFLQEKIKVVIESESYKKGQVRVPLALLKSALKNNYVGAKEKIASSETKKSRGFSWDQKKKYTEYQHKIILEQFFALEKADQSILEKKFSDYLDKKMHENMSYRISKEMFLLQGIKGVLSEFSEFAMTTHEPIVIALLSIEQYIEMQ